MILDYGKGIRFTWKLRWYMFRHGIDQNVWYILSALRGPDFPRREYFKGKFHTGVIRGWALSNRSKAKFLGDIERLSSPEAMQDWIQSVVEARLPADHFMLHIELAARAIAKIEGWRI